MNINATERKDGLSEAEGRIMDALCGIFNDWQKLPVQHPGDALEVMNAVHKVQDLLAVRIARRHYPDGWPIKAEGAPKGNEG